LIFFDIYVNMLHSVICWNGKWEGPIMEDLLGALCSALALAFFVWAAWWIRRSGAPRRRQIEEAFPEE
jgi:hypothetical protein